MENLNNNIKLFLNKKDKSFANVRMSYILQNPMHLILEKKNKYEMLVKTLKLVNPLGILEKGYSLVSADDKIIKSSTMVKENDLINIKLYEGQIKAIVKNIVK